MVMLLSFVPTNRGSSACDSNGVHAMPDIHFNSVTAVQH
jgi:hypothetical protein